MDKIFKITLSIVIIILVLVGSFVFIWFVIIPHSNESGNISDKNQTTQNEEIRKTLVCTRNCNENPSEPMECVRDCPPEGKLYYYRPATLTSFDYEREKEKYLVEATFRSNTACDVKFDILNGKQISGVTILPEFQTGTITFETSNLSDVSVMIYDGTNNQHIGKYMCGGRVNSRFYAFE